MATYRVIHPRCPICNRYMEFIKVYEAAAGTKKTAWTCHRDTCNGILIYVYQFKEK